MLEHSETETDMLVPIEFDGHDVYIAARTIKSQDSGEDVEEYQIVAREPRLERVLDGLTGFARQVVTRLQATDASKVTVQFGCEIAVESGSFVAVIGKASSKSTMTVSLEWTARSP
jgi:hypothetical protein